jgi:hypothetical protein
MIIEHVRRPVYRRIDKKVKERIEDAIAHHTDVDMVKEVRHILNNAIDQEYLATLVAFVPEGSKIVAVGYAQRMLPRDVVLGEDDLGNEIVQTDGDDFTRQEGVAIAEGRAYSYLLKNIKDSVFLPNLAPNKTKNVFELPSHVRKNFVRFMDRAKRYYKDKEFVPWAVNVYELITHRKF